MVKLDKTGIPLPSELQSGSRGDIATRQLMANYDAGLREFDFDSAIFGHPSIKSALNELQNGKCCFCESPFKHIMPGDVEHFRPKAGYLLGKYLIKPGYYWLAYDFSNLYLSCEICNRTFKKNYFPLENETNRVRSHHDHERLADENPLLIHLEDDEPADHIEFNREIPIGKDKKGKTTIERLGLDRYDLNEERLRYYELIAFIADKARTGDEKALQIIKKAALSTERYSLMIRCNFADLLSST